MNFDPDVSISTVHAVTNDKENRIEAVKFIDIEDEITVPFNPWGYNKNKQQFKKTEIELREDEELIGVYGTYNDDYVTSFGYIVKRKVKKMSTGFDGE